jgi:putative CocE/NonD family hydrolase
MTVRAPRWLAVAVVLLAAALTITLVAVVTRSKSPHPLSSASGAHTIVTSDGTNLSALAYVPKGAGPFPLIVMPASWGAGASEYTYVAAGFAALGFIAISYAERGFDTSTGKLDLGGPSTVSDVSTVISWGLAHTPANKSQVGLVGASYGGGVALLAAEHDPRIKAVVAMSGWTDLAAVMTPGGTPSAQLFTTELANQPADRTTADVQKLVGQLRTRDAAAATATVRSMSPSRSPITGIAPLNKNGTAVMLADDYQDSLLPPQSAITFFNRLSGPKRLEIAAGDHAGSALSGLYGHKSPVWTNAAKWMDRFLRGTDNGIDKQDPIQLEDAATQQTHAYKTWADVGHNTRYYLSGANGEATAQITSTANAPWTRVIKAGVDTDADAGPEQFTSTLAYQPPTVSLGAISSADGAAWNGPALAASTMVNGIVQVHTAVRASASSVSLFAYLYDVDASGSGSLINQGALTLRGVQPGSTHPAQISLQPISWTVAAGHHLSLVIDTVDPRYVDQSVPGSTVTFASTTADPATLTVPVS